MKRILIAMGLCAALGVQAAMVWPSQIFDNPGFEDDNPYVGTTPPSGWSLSGSPGEVAVVTSHAWQGIGLMSGTLYPFNLGPWAFSGDNQFVRIRAGTGSGGVGIYQDVYMNAGDTVWGAYAFDQVNASRQGRARLSVLNLDSEETVLTISTTPNADTSWTAWSFTAIDSANYRFNFGAVNATSGSGWSGYAMFDMTTIPEPRGWLMGGALLGMLGVGEFLRRRRQQKAANA